MHFSPANDGEAGRPWEQGECRSRWQADRHPQGGFLKLHSGTTEAEARSDRPQAARPMQDSERAEPSRAGAQGRRADSKCPAAERAAPRIAEQAAEPGEFEPGVSQEERSAEPQGWKEWKN